MKKYSLLLIILFIINNGYSQNKKEITLDDIWTNYSFFPKLINGIKSMKDGEHYCIVENGNINKYDYKTGKIIIQIVNKDKLIPDGKTSAISIDSYDFSADEKKILIATERKSIYRHSFMASYYIYDLEKKAITALSDKKQQRLATFSPDGEKVVFVRDNNLFIKTLKTGIEEQITNDGKINCIINGGTDWVYEEELDITKAFEWSSDGSKIAFLRFDESNVKEYSFPVYGNLYPEEYKYKYPKAGEDNSVVKVLVYDLINRSTKQMDIGNVADQYIPRISWTQETDVLSILRLNRRQDKLDILFANANTGASKVIFTETNKYYIDFIDNPTYLQDKKHFILSSSRDGFKHIYLFNMQGQVVKQLTKGKWDVDDFIGLDEKNKTVYYSSSESSPTERDIYSVKLNGEDKKKLSARKGDNKASFSTGFKYYVNTFSDANTPPVITVSSNDGRQIRILEDNKKLNEKMKDYNFNSIDFYTFKTSEGIDLNGWMLKPADFSESKKYPVFMTVYGGPGSQTVKNKWGYMDYVWYQMLAEKGYIIVSVDNRGTGARGEEFMKCTFKQLGKLESTDQAEAAKYLATLPYVDSKRIGIWGWSYGGFMTALCMTKEADYFKVGIAVAPVTNWRYYDNIYTERFMITPKENPEGYDENSPIKYAKELKGKFLLIHGTTDDNVHFQNSVELADALIKENKQFEIFYYPNKNHFITGGTTRLNLYTKMTEFIIKNL